MAKRKRLPIVMVHVRITGVTGHLEDTEPLRDAIHTLVAEFADRYGLRIKRRRVSLARGVDLMVRYEARAKLHELIE